METLLPQTASGRFKAPRSSLGDVDADTAANLISAAADIALIVDQSGVIRDLAVGSDLVALDCGSWVGRKWVDTVTVESRPKIEEMLREADSGGMSRWRQVNHPSRSGAPDVPIRYSTVSAGSRGRIVALGRDLSAMAVLQQRLIEAQLLMEREYARLRHAETRYRLLFQIASEAVLIVDAATNRVVEVNPAAARLLGKASGEVTGTPVLELFGRADRQEVQAILSIARASGRADGAKAHLQSTGQAVEVATSIFRKENGSHFLVRLTRDDGAAKPPDARTSESRLARLVEEFPDGFVVTGLDRRVLAANQAFLGLASLASAAQAVGQMLDRWLGRSGVDFNVLVANLKEHGSVRNFPTLLRGEFGTSEEVEVSAVAVSGGDEPCLGFVIRPLGRRPAGEPRGTRALPRSVEQLTELIGRVPLKDLVRETTDVIERLCIDAALQLTGDNRASAAQMLGLSRQSLYVKLRRYGLEGPGSEGEDP